MRRRITRLRFSRHRSWFLAWLFTFFLAFLTFLTFLAFLIFLAFLTFTAIFISFFLYLLRLQLSRLRGRFICRGVTFLLVSYLTFVLTFLISLWLFFFCDGILLFNF